MPKKRFYRKLGRKYSHRKALLRNLVTSLVQHENILTTWAKAKEAQKQAEKLITIAKKNGRDHEAWIKASNLVFQPKTTLTKVFDELAPRFQERPGGYTRVLRMPPRFGDNAPQGVLEFVDGPGDSRFYMTAKIIGICQARGKALTEVTELNKRRVLAFRKGGEEEFQRLVECARQEELQRVQADQELENCIREGRVPPKDWKLGDPIPRPTYVS
ncbi:mitochondrial 54S ribosomal protein YmL8 [Schizosaccharomyces japonicus yFS275]|uniref:Ribosomal protein subunit L8 n=1 Tax=Schizosaccharomyces japonicus (strain yFS275 / FY16936) TaxID=402676 RepID=B6JYD1_SCHJY|nr:mitochondrial 54S ribosomal protein YmL8 [Schizosaccharomyces japonicus yFS275]EEB06549.1 ribosomal protein subunit L8 [Schizosaccharomyces japonicus yFS275]